MPHVLHSVEAPNGKTTHLIQSANTEGKYFFKHTWRLGKCSHIFFFNRIFQDTPSTFRQHISMLQHLLREALD